MIQELPRLTYGGNTCQNDLDFCTTSSFQNSGLCVEGRGSQTSCNCLADFTGASCSVAIDTTLISCPFEENQVWMLLFKCSYEVPSFDDRV